MKFHLGHIIPVIFILLLAACKKKVTQESLINSAVEIKLQQWREEKINTCKEKALADAQKYVDSVLLATSLETKLDTIPKPEKPIKPPKPEFKPKPDSVIVTPIIKKG